MKKKIRNRMIALFLVLLIILTVFWLSYLQASRPLPQRCGQINGSCQEDCAGYNLPDPDGKKLDCPGTLICCVH
jgi:hypothetical protein